MSNYILSFPRSGNHLVRGLVEFLTQRPTNGCPGNHEDTPIASRLKNKTDLIHVAGPAEWSKAHRPSQEVKRADPSSKLIAIVRHPLESIASHYKSDQKFTIQSLHREISPGSHLYGMYMDVLRKYNAWQGPKLIVYYEDLVFDEKNNHADVARQLAKFVNAEEKLEECLTNWGTITSLTKNVALQRKPESNTINFYRKRFGFKNFVAPADVYHLLNRYNDVTLAGQVNHVVAKIPIIPSKPLVNISRPKPAVARSTIKRMRLRRVTKK